MQAGTRPPMTLLLTPAALRSDQQPGPKIWSTGYCRRAWRQASWYRAPGWIRLSSHWRDLLENATNRLQRHDRRIQILGLGLGFERPTTRHDTHTTHNKHLISTALQSTLATGTPSTPNNATTNAGGSAQTQAIRN